MVYSSDNLKLLFLSPYVKVRIDSEGLYFCQTVLSAQISMKAESEWTVLFVKNLQMGMTADDVLASLRELYVAEKAENVFKMLLQGGVIE